MREGKEWREGGVAEKIHRPGRTLSNGWCSSLGASRCAMPPCSAFTVQPASTLVSRRDPTDGLPHSTMLQAPRHLTLGLRESSTGARTGHLGVLPAGGLGNRGFSPLALPHDGWAWRGRPGRHWDMEDYLR